MASYPIKVTKPLSQATLRPIQAPLYDCEDFGFQKSNSLTWLKCKGGFILQEHKDGKLIREKRFTGRKYAEFLVAEKKDKK